MMEMIGRLSDKILEKYLLITGRRGRKPFPGDYEKKLSLLSPGKESKKLIKDYYSKKVVNIILSAAASLVLLVLMIIRSVTDDKIRDGYILKRTEVGTEGYNISLNAVTDEGDIGPIDIRVEERRLSDKECEEAMNGLYEKLPAMILADNVSLSCIDSNLSLPAAVEGYPFSLRWESSDYSLIDSAGNVHNEGIDDEGVPIDLKVVMTYKDKEESFDIKAVVYPRMLEGKELFIKQIYDKAKAENEENSFRDYYRLPSDINGKRISWKEIKEPVVPVVIVIGFSLVFGLWLGTDKDLNRKYEDRNRQMIIDYAEFVSKLQILLSSGATIRTAFEHMVIDYKKSRLKGGGRRYVYEELELCVRKLGDGMSEGACYEYFGKRCNILCYRKLMSILIQNLRKGTDGLIEAMDNEVHTAFEERKAMAKRMGEEAQTKLIFPMMLQLGVVMIIIMIPAYLSFGVM